MSAHAHDPNCVFCKIVRGEVPSSTVLATSDAVVFLDNHPVNKGHVLVVPRAHHADLTELPDHLAAHVGGLLPKVCRAVKAATGADGFNIIVNNGAAAGQTVGHGHWHVIPRFHADPVNWPWPHDDYVGDELGQMRCRIERALGLGGGE
jgi:histidine triad (HIT) family protein